VDVRILSATNADVREEVRAGRFREDLLFRLNTVEIRLPPLRDRAEDIPLLARHFLATHAARYRRAATAFDPAALDALVRHAWPGNVRELDHVIERAVLLAQGERIGTGDLALAASDGGGLAPLEQMTLADAEGFLIRRALDRAGGNVSLAARALGLSRSALYRRLERLDL
jgi:DNA-binding NtrC family response regulator